MKFITKLCFHSNGTPRQWLKSLVFDEQLVPRSLFRSIVYDSSGAIKSDFAPWLRKALENPPMSKNNDWEGRRRQIVAERLLSRVTSVTVVCSRQTVFVAEALRKQLLTMGFAANVRQDMPEGFTDDLYVVICPQLFDRLPPREKRIVFQMEQSVSPRWFTQDYLNVLYNSLAVFDYSINNIDFLQKQGLPAEALFHIPLSPIPSYLSDEIVQSLARDQAQSTCEVLFYGDIKNKRRQEFLQVLKSHFDVRVETNLYGESLWRAVAGAKVVVNIHYYEGALLESTRICECLSLGGRMVSEMAADQGQYSDWEDLLLFTPINDIPAMVEAIHVLLKNPQLFQSELDNREFKFPAAVRQAFLAMNIASVSAENV